MKRVLLLALCASSVLSDDSREEIDPLAKTTKPSATTLVPLLEENDDPDNGNNTTAFESMFAETTEIPTSPVPDSNCTDLVNPRTGKSDCLSRAELCQLPKYQEFMRKTCPKTCGYCGNSTRRIEPKNCADLYPMCPRYKKHCNNPRSEVFMKKNCPKTCAVCNSTEPKRIERVAVAVPECKDAATTVFGNKKCPQVRHLCDKESMRTDCAATCGYCVKMKEACKDQLKSCKKVICNARADLKSYMEEMCPVTCDYCDPAL